MTRSPAPSRAKRRWVAVNNCVPDGHVLNCMQIVGYGTAPKRTVGGSSYVMWSVSAFRLKVIKMAFVAMYAMIVMAAFRYQVVGDRALQFYIHPNSPLENILIALIRDDVRALLAKIIAAGAAVFSFILLSYFKKHALQHRIARDDTTDERPT